MPTKTPASMFPLSTGVVGTNDTVGNADPIGRKDESSDVSSSDTGIANRAPIDDKIAPSRSS